MIADLYKLMNIISYEAAAIVTSSGLEETSRQAVKLAQGSLPHYRARLVQRRTTLDAEVSRERGVLLLLSA